MIEPELSVRLLFKVKEPLAVLPEPPSRCAPELIVTVPLIVPVPPSTVPELLTVTALPDAIEPLTRRVPPFTAVAPV